MKCLIAAVLLVIFIYTAALPQNLTEIQRQVRQSVDSRNYPAAITELRLLQTDDETAFMAGNYDYMLARMAEADGQLAAAMSHYQATANRDSILKPYALKHLSQIARSTGNFMLERIYLDEILLFSANSLIAKSVSFRLANNSFEAGNFKETIRILTSVYDAKPGKNARSANTRDTQTLLAEAYLHSGQTERGRAMFTDLLDTVPNAAQPDDVALTATKSLDFLDGGGVNRRVPELPETEHLRRANIYQFNRDFAGARLHFEALLANYPSGANTAEAAFQIGRGFAQQAEFVEAVKWFERVLEQYPKSASAKEALLHAASAYGRVGKPREAITRYLSFIEKYPTDEKLDRAYLNIIDIQRDHGEDTDALKWCAKTQEVFRGKRPEAVALFTEARIYIAREDWQRALNALERLRTFPDLGGSTVPGGTNIDEITFLKGFLLEQLKRYGEAIDAYLSIADGRGEYFGWRATERLKLLPNDETAKSYIAQTTGYLMAGLQAKDADARRKNAQSLLRLTDDANLRQKAIAVLQTAVKLLPKYQSVPSLKFPSADTHLTPAGRSIQSVGETLLSLGLYDEAAPEIEAAMSVSAKVTPDNSFVLATYYKRGGRANRGIAFIEPIWRKMPADYPIELIPRDHLEMLYPTPYADTLLKSALERGVDPRLVLAIMRQESRFDPDAKSYAAARGLMQFITTTSARVAGEMGRDNYREDDLYFPPTAILFGSQYLADLFKSFPDQPDAVVASYNGGDDNMKRWLARSRSNMPERYVPEIVYSQSKDYVYKVMANYRMYQYLYDERLRTGPQASCLP